MVLSNLTEKRVKIIKTLVVSDHLLHNDSSTDFNNFGIVVSDACNFNLLIKESLLIKRENFVNILYIIAFYSCV